MNVAHNRCEVFIRIDEDGLVTASEKGAVSMVGAVEALCVNTAQMAHNAGKVARGCPQAEMVVIVHKAVSDNLDPP